MPNSKRPGGVCADKLHLNAASVAKGGASEVAAGTQKFRKLTAEEGIGKGDIDESGAGYFDAVIIPGSPEVCNDFVSERPRFFPSDLAITMATLVVRSPCPS